MRIIKLEEQPSDQDSRTTTDTASYSPLSFMSIVSSTTISANRHLTCQIQSSSIWVTISIRCWLTEVSLMHSFLLLFLTSEQKRLQQLGLYFRMIFPVHSVLCETVSWSAVPHCYINYWKNWSGHSALYIPTHYITKGMNNEGHP